MSKEFKDMNQEELAKAHKSAMDHLGLAKAEHAAHVAEMHKAHDAHQAVMHGHLDNVAKAMGCDTVPMQTTKAVVADTLKKEDASKPAKTQEEIITETVTAVLNKAMGIEPEKELTLEEKITKAVNAALEPVLQKAVGNRPRFVPQENTEKELTETEKVELAKKAASGDREAQLKMFKSTSASQLSQASRA
jgi:hypothetical protein